MEEVGDDRCFHASRMPQIQLRQALSRQTPVGCVACVKALSQHPASTHEPATEPERSSLGEALQAEETLKVFPKGSRTMRKV